MGKRREVQEVCSESSQSCGVPLPDYTQKNRAPCRHQFPRQAHFGTLAAEVDSGQVRLQLPYRIPLERAIAVLVALACVQLYEGTTFFFTLLFFAFALMAVLAFNVAEGFATFPGVYVFFFSTLTVILGVFWKAVLREPANSNLLDPMLTMSVYTVSMALLLLVVIIIRRIDFRSDNVAAVFRANELNYTIAALGSLAFGLAVIVLSAVLPPAANGILAVLHQLNVPFVVLAILLGTIGIIQESGGRRSMGFINGLAMAVVFVQGLTTFSKQGLLTPGACWLAAAAYTRLKLRPMQYVGLVGFAILTLYFADPWSGARNDVPATGAGFSQRLQLVAFELRNFQSLRERAHESGELYKESGAISYFDTSQGLLDRLTMFTPDDQLIAYSARVRFEGYKPILEDFENWIPHVLAPNKPIPIGGNYYAHEVGGLAPDDFTTGVSYSPVSEAYHLDGWTSVLLLLPAIWFLLFLSVDFTTSGDLRRGPWALILIVYFAHAAPESLLGGLIFYIFNGNVAMLFAMFFCTRIAPTVGVFFYGRQRIEALQPRRPLPRPA